MISTEHVISETPKKEVMFERDKWFHAFYIQSMLKTVQISSLSILAWDVHDAQLTKHDSLAEGDEHLGAVLTDHVNLASLDDVHLPPHISFLANIVTGGIHLPKL